MAAYGFLALVEKLQEAIFEDLPGDIFTGTTPAWWPVPWLVLCGLLTASAIRYLPGNGGHSPAFGFQLGGWPAGGPGPARSRLRGPGHVEPRHAGPLTDQEAPQG